MVWGERIIVHIDMVSSSSAEPSVLHAYSCFSSQRCNHPFSHEEHSVSIKDHVVSVYSLIQFSRIIFLSRTMVPFHIHSTTILSSHIT